jgi:hypothetical protein
MNPKFPTNTAIGGASALSNKIYFRRAGVVRIVEMYMFSNVACTNENVSVYFRLNDTTDTLVATVGTSSQEHVFSNTAINITVAAGDYCEFKMTTPAWATNPGVSTIGGYMLVE